MPDPVFLAIAAAVAAKGTEALVDGGRSAVTALVRLIRGRLRPGARDGADPERDGSERAGDGPGRGGSAGEAVAGEAAVDPLLAVLSRPDDPAVRRRLAEVLDRAATEDPAFRERLLAVWATAAVELGVPQSAVGVADNSGVVNTVTGTVAGGVVQARDVHGGISFGSGPPG